MEKVRKSENRSWNMHLLVFFYISHFLLKILEELKILDLTQPDL